MAKQFVDLSRLSDEDFDDLERMCKLEGLTFEQAIHELIKKNDSKVRTLGIIKDNGEIEAHKISMDGVKELKGKDALDHIFEEVLNDEQEDELD